MTASVQARAPLRPGRRLHALLAFAAVVALLQSAVSVLLNDDLAGWRPDHGHIHAGMILPPHTHPYDRSGPAAAHPVTEDPNLAFVPVELDEGGDGAPSEIVLTPPQDGLSDSVASPLLVNPGEPRLARALPQRLEQPPASRSPAAHSVTVTTPPPR